ncbi:alpha/beta hydrolase [Marivibrio halodurans]|uniref:Alpha/beta hydrolase n=1 Tax=Marivibrio halodurans TaxID=2039722 RepID=A0A8J7V1Z2_9PROT|nr:alpha/beta hydrolase [Marivibrio halodurans]MBP5856845.1 alpha/beta hydrolase [Marivibrio halodurans]
MPFWTSRGAKLFCHQEGGGAPILLIPGLGLDHQYYRLATPFLAESLSVHAVDPRGIGQSDAGDRPFTVEEWAADLAEMIPQLGVGPVHVLGTSLGGAMALALAEAAPDMVRSLTVVGAFSELDRAAVLNFDLRKRLIEKLGFSAEVADYMGLWTMTREFINSDEGYAQMQANQKIIRNNSPERYLEFVRSVLAWGRELPEQKDEPKFTARLGGITAPTLVVGSANDHLIPLRLSEIIAENIPGADLVVMPDGGHIPFVEKPREASRIVLDFVTNH